MAKEADDCLSRAARQRAPTRIVGGLAGGMTKEEIIREYEVTEEDIWAALNYATELIEAEEFYPLPVPVGE